MAEQLGYLGAHQDALLQFESVIGKITEIKNGGFFYIYFNDAGLAR